MSIKIFISQNNISEAWEDISLNFTNSQNNLSEAWECFFKITNSQIDWSEAWAHFFQIIKARRAQKDISEALEQFHSSKNLSEA